MLTINSSTPYIESAYTETLLLSGKMANLFLIIIFAVFLCMEHFYPRERLSVKKVFENYGTNLSLFVFNSIVLSIVSASLLLPLARAYSSGWLFHFVHNRGGQFVMSFLLYDLSLYLWHRASHSNRYLWLFHRVHHSDPQVNVSTALRLHLMDVLVILLVKAFYILLFGFDVSVVLANEVLNTLFLMFHHSNLVVKGEKFLGYLIIVPSLHRVHHSRQRQEHDNNYGAVLSIWDRLFGTFAVLEPKAVGLEGGTPQDVIGLIKYGFALNAPKPKRLNVEALESMIAEAAYYKAERRNFYPGYEIRDWLEAKKEIIKQVYGEQTISGRGVNKASDFSEGQACC